MKKQAKKTWLAALRSGRYTPVAAKLHATSRGKKDAMCCLGVLCDVLIDGEWVKSKHAPLWKFVPDNPDFSDAHHGMNIHPYLPPLNATDALGLTGPQVARLATINDDAVNAGESDYARVIEYIERNL